MKVELHMKMIYILVVNLQLLTISNLTQKCNNHVKVVVLNSSVAEKININEYPHTKGNEPHQLILSYPRVFGRKTRLFSIKKSILVMNA